MAISGELSLSTAIHHNLSPYLQDYTPANSVWASRQNAGPPAAAGPTGRNSATQPTAEIRRSAAAVSGSRSPVTPRK